MMDLDVLITGGVGVITSLTSAWISWFFTRKKYNAEVTSDIIDNMQKSLDFYRKIADDNQERLEKILERNAALEREILELKKQVADLTIQLDKKNKKR